MIAGEGAISQAERIVGSADTADPHTGVELAEWRRRHVGALAGALVLAICLRLLLLPTQGMRPDLDQFAQWAHAFAMGLPLGHAYRLNLSFPPVLTYLIWALGNLVPSFATATDASDVGVRVALKIPASLADLGLALGVAYLLRNQPRRAVAGALLIALVPVTWYVSAWWGQFESIYVLLGLVAAILLLADRPMLAAVALGLALMTKPQALPFLVPFAAYALGRYGWRRAAMIGTLTLATAAVTWLPFVADGGPARYAANLNYYQDGMFAVLSLRAWNVWWVLQELFAGGSFVADNVPLIGPITPRLLGYVMGGLAEVAVFLLVLRRPTREGLLLGLAATVLVAFSLMTTMHERYSYGAVIFLLPVALAAARRERAAWVALAAAVAANLVAAVPESALPASLSGAAAALWPIGCAAILGAAALTVAVLRPPDVSATP
jgi:Gpi18-like mannosyltransferase